MTKRPEPMGEPTRKILETPFLIVEQQTATEPEPREVHPLWTHFKNLMRDYYNGWTYGPPNVGDIAIATVLLVIMTGLVLAIPVLVTWGAMEHGNWLLVALAWAVLGLIAWLLFWASYEFTDLSKGGKK